MHAVRGERERYRPLGSKIVAGSDPVQVACAVREALGLGELYVAELDAIAGGPGHRDVLAALAREARVMVDAGVSELAAVRSLLELGAARVVIGTKTLASQAALERLRAELPDAPLVLSLDLRAGRVLSRDAGLARLGAAGALLATALHGGAIGPGELSALGERGGRQPTTVSRCSTSAAATSTPVARSTPCQPGMPLTSST